MCVNTLLSVYHDFFCQFGKTKIFVTKKPEGFGLVCHRAIKTTCEVIGIKDLYAKIEGPTNLQHIIKAFFIGLLQQVSWLPECNYYVSQCLSQKTE
jgi:small subunit ribosomal protein S5